MWIVLRYWEICRSAKVSRMSLDKKNNISTIIKGCLRCVCNVTSRISMQCYFKNFNAIY